MRRRYYVVRSGYGWIARACLAMGALFLAMTAGTWVLTEVIAPVLPVVAVVGAAALVIWLLWRAR